MKKRAFLPLLALLSILFWACPSGENTRTSIKEVSSDTIIVERWSHESVLLLERWRNTQFDSLLENLGIKMNCSTCMEIAFDIFFFVGINKKPKSIEVELAADLGCATIDKEKGALIAESLQRYVASLRLREEWVEKVIKLCFIDGLEC